MVVRSAMERKGKRKLAECEKNVIATDCPIVVCLPETMTEIFVCIALLGLLVRSAVSTHPYSGAGVPPKFGDYEAQRHWMEITLNLPPQEWYHNGTNNDLHYWGLDYPPLTAYQSYLHGLILQRFLPESVALHSSRGYESYFGKLLMRWTVLSSDLIILFPAVLWFAIVKYGNHVGNKRVDVARHLVVLLINPCLILIDHGHFQYNCISLGFAIAAVAAVLSDKDLFGSVLFCLSLNHKQMSAYFAPAFFSHLLGKSIRQKHAILQVLKLGLVVSGTFAAVWWPYLHSRSDLVQVLLRLAPFERGIYEDYVANFWCTTSVLIKWKRLFSIQSLRLCSLAATLLACLPSMVHQILNPSSKGFLYGLLNSAFSFYLFSFQVHEKSILLPLMPATLLALEWPWLFFIFVHYAMFSMFPLMLRDNLFTAYVGLYAMFSFLFLGLIGKQHIRSLRPVAIAKGPILVIALYVCSLGLHFLYLTIKPPFKYPFLFEAMIMLLCFLHFSLFAVYMNAKQWMLAREETRIGKGKKWD